jgi:methylase of polypeptide subunit release factors
MKLYAFTTPEITKHNGYLKIGETNGDIDKRVDQECHALNVTKEIVWRDFVITQRSHIDKMIHHHLVNQGFQIQQFDKTSRDTEWIKCTIADVENAFNTVKQQLLNNEIQRQTLCDKFYLEIRNWYFWSITAINNSISHDYVLRIVIRLLLCFFLKEKQLMPNELFDENFIKENLKENEEFRYYNAILYNLFFRCLNTPIKERNNIEHKKLIKNIHNIKKQLQKIPFLNGGLFHELNDDNFPLNDDYFFSESRTRHLPELGGDCKVAGIIRILSQYQYKLTVDDLPDLEYTQTVDPEFIGKVFESLLSCIDTDNKETRRKVTGSYYTPREIVDYMVGEALDTYLLKNNDLLQCKILDPSCGSGAFPCGVMNEIIRRIDPDKQLSQKQRYQKKLKILQKVIYCVDVQPMATQISSLRLFLSLIQEIIPNKTKENYGIEPLPNLDTKFICANALIGLQKESQGFLVSPSIKFAVEELKTNRDQYVTANTLQEKQKIQKYDEELRDSFSQLLEDEAIFSHDTTGYLLQWNPYDQTTSADFFDPQWMFGVDKFDIVIGNPPYVRADNTGVLKQRQTITKIKQYETLYEKWDLLVPFIERGLKLLVDGGQLRFILSNAITTAKYADKIQKWILENHFVKQIDYFDNIKIFNQAIVPVILSIVANQKDKTTKKIYHKNKFNNKEIIEIDNTGKNLQEKIFRHSYNPKLNNQKIETIKLGDICYLSVGMVVNADEKTEKGLFARDDLVSSTKDKIHCQEYVEAKNIAAYHIAQVRYIEYNTQRVPDKLRRPTFRELYVGTKILQGGMTGGTIDETGIVCNHSITVIKRFCDLQGVDNKSIKSSISKNNKNKTRNQLEKLSENYDLRFLLGIINSQYAKTYMNNFRRSTIKDSFYPDDFRNLPIPTISLENQKPLIQLVDQIITTKKINHNANTITLEKQINTFVYKLYGINPTE